MLFVEILDLDRTCYDCPTVYEGTTVDGKFIYMYLRHGVMTIDLDDDEVLREHPVDLDGICDFSDFQRYAEKHDVHLMWS